jgi:tRNA threonylcarbamoyladenosine biosynthesis protein TsaE
MEMDVKSSIGMWDVAREALSRLADAPKDRAAVLALSGELGAGKTTFTQALAGVLGAAGPVQSPTYVILKKHQLKGGRWHTLAHIDAYRLGGAADLAAIGWGELAADPGVLLVVEWPERVPEALPDGALWLRFSHETLETRKVTVG